VLETWFSPNDNIRKYLLVIKHCSTKNAFWDLNNKKWRKWYKYVSPFLFNNTWGLPVLTTDAKCENQLFYVWLFYQQCSCAKYGIETRFYPNDDVRKGLTDMKLGSTKNACWDVNKKEWNKWCEYDSPFLFNETYVLHVLTKDTKCPNEVFYVWLVDLQAICVR
jgi:hypothetical protein